MTDGAVRPLLLWRVPFDRGDGCGEYLRDLFRAEQGAIYDELRGVAPADMPAESRQQLVWSIDLLRDIDEALLVPFENRRNMRLFRGGMAEWVQEVLRDEQAALLDDLAGLRAAGKPETDPEIEAVRQRLFWLVNILRDVGAGLVNLAGPDEDPRDK